MPISPVYQHIVALSRCHCQALVIVRQLHPLERRLLRVYCQVAHKLTSTIHIDTHCVPNPPNSQLHAISSEGDRPGSASIRGEVLYPLVCAINKLIDDNIPTILAQGHILMVGSDLDGVHSRMTIKGVHESERFGGVIQHVDGRTQIICYTQPMVLCHEYLPDVGVSVVDCLVQGQFCPFFLVYFEGAVIVPHCDIIHPMSYSNTLYCIKVSQCLGQVIVCTFTCCQHQEQQSRFYDHYYLNNYLISYISM